MRERPLSPLWLRALALGALSLLLSIFSWWEMLAAYPKTQNGDGQFFHEMIEAMRVSILDYHELPLWNPYQCGGVPLWDNPQGVSAAPLLWAVLPLGTTRGNEVWYIVHSAVGFACMWLFARHELKVSRAGSIVASAAFAFAGAHNQHLTGGHLVWAPYLYFPLGLLLWRRAEHDLRYAIGLGALVAWTMHEGGTYPLPYLALMLGLETLMRLWPVKRILPIARAGVVVALVGFGLGASRFLPVWGQLHFHTRQLADEHDRMTWQTLTDVFLARNHGRDMPGQEYVWTEFGDYLGPIILVLSVIGVFTAGLETWWMLALLVVSFATMLGHQGAWAPASILKTYIYPFKQMRVPSRIDAVVTVFLAGYAGLAVDRIGRLALRLPGRWRLTEAVRTATLAIALIGAGDIISVGISFGTQFFTSTPARDKVAPSPRLYLGGKDLAPFIDQPRQHRGQLDCWEEWAFERDAPLWADDVPQARAVDGAATVRSVSRTQNTFTLDVSSTAPARILLNSGYDRGWRASVGTAVRAGKQLAIDVPAGDHVVRVKYWPHGLTAGFVLVGVTAVLIALYLVRDGRWRRREA